MAVFDNRIFFTFTGQSPNNATAPIYPLVAVFDLTEDKFISVTKLGSTPLHSDNLAQGKAAGAAIAVLNNMLYLFTDTNTWTSANGNDWASHTPGLITNANDGALIDYQIEDAITIFPSDSDPKILLLLGYTGSEGSTYDYLTSVTWNGQFGANSDYSPSVATTIVYQNSITDTAGLLTGTARSPDHDYFTDGAKAASVQLFVQFLTSSNYDVKRLEYNYQTTPGKWTIDPQHLHPCSNCGVYDLVAFPWYTDECSNDGATRIQRQHLSLNTYE